MISYLVYYALSFLVASALLFVLRRRQDARHNQLQYALLGLVFASVAGGLLVYVQPPGLIVYMLILQLVSWGLFLWGLGLTWQMWGAGLVVLGVVAFLPPLPGWEILSWGLLTAVPLTIFTIIRQSATPNIPIFTSTKITPYQQPTHVSGDVSQAAIQSQQPILECLTDGIVFSGVDGTITYANQAAATIIGQGIPALVGHPVTDILTHLPMLAASSETVKSSPVGRRLEHDNFEINGRIIHGRMTIIYNSDGIAQGTVAILRDITTEFNAERSRDGFLTTISHELRTPLTAIKGYAELLDSGAGGPLTDMQKSFTKPIQRNVTRMVQLINSLIFAAAVKGGQMEFASGHANISQIIHQITREMMPKAAASGQRFSLHLEEHLSVVQADPIHITIILEELVANAIKYNKNGGEIWIRAGLQRDESQQQEFIVISIKDEGVGIHPDDQAHIFEDFFHPDEADTHVRAGGIGIGLSVVQALVEAYNGRVWLESAPGQGSTFFFLIPVQQTETTLL